MDCKEFRERLDLYVDGELSQEAADEARAHLKGCASCARAEAGLRHLRRSLKRVVNRHAPPPALERDVLRSLRSRKRADARGAPDKGRRDATPVWRAKVAMPVPLLALLVFSVVALAGWLVFAGGAVREEVSSGRPAPSPTHTLPGEASGGFDFSRYYRGERASIKVVRRAGAERSAQ